MRQAILGLVLLGCVGDEAQLADAPCPAGRATCGGACVDLASDPSHCGACDSACEAGQVCSTGTCATGCGQGTELCGDRCADTMVDPQNCGACGIACPAGQVCSLGDCGAGCGGGTTLCNGLCVDLGTDPHNCGDCGMACATGSLCVAQSCQPPASCKELHQRSATLPDGVYLLDPDGPAGEAAFLAHCDMTTEGGGFTLVASVVDNSFFAGTSCSTMCDMNPATTCDETPFTSARPVGDAATFLQTDHKSAAYASVAFTEMLFADSNGQHALYDVSGASVLAWYPAGLQNYVPEGVEEHPTFSYPVKATNVDVGLNNCGTLRVSFNVEDSDSALDGGCHSSIKGPSWSRASNNLCYWDDGGVRWTSSAFYAGNDTSHQLWLVR